MVNLEEKVKNRRSPDKNMKRRTFLKSLTLAGIATLLSSETNDDDEQFHDENIHQSQWDFLNLERRIYENDRAIRENCPPLGPLIEFNPENPLFEAEKLTVISSVLRTIGERGLNIVGEPTIERLNIELFGTPLENRSGQQFAEYCQLAISYLHDQVTGLPEIPINAQIVRSGDNYRNYYSYKWFLTGGVHQICSIIISFRLDNGNIWRDARTAYDQNKGSVNASVENDYFICLEAGEGALRVPFAEAIPIITRDTNRDYLEQTGNYLHSRRVIETFSEAAAQILSRQLALELNIPRGAEDIDLSLVNLVERSRDRYLYEFVPLAIDWMEKNGLQQAFEMYTQNPARFMEEIN